MMSNILVRNYPERPPVQRLALLATRFLIFYLIFLIAGSLLISPRVGDTGVSVFYAPLAILAYLFFVSQSWRARAKATLAFVAAGLSWVYMDSHSVVGSLPYLLIDIADAATVAWLLRRYGTQGLALRRPYRVTLFLGVIFIVSATFAFAAAMVPSLDLGTAVITNSKDVPLIWRDWLFGDFTAYVSILAALLIIGNQFALMVSRLIRARWKEFSACVVFLLIAVLYDFDVIQAIFGDADRNIGVSATPNTALLLVIVPAIMWLAYSFRQLGAATGIFILSIPSIHFVAQGFGPIWLSDAPDRVLILQAYVCCTAIASLYIAALSHQVKHREFLLKRALWFARKRAHDRADFLATFSHELRTPLNGILGFTQIMLASEGGKLSPRHRDFIDMIDQSSKQLLAMITEVLSLQRMRQDAFALDVELLRAVDVAQEVIAMVSGIAAREQITVENNIPVNLQLTANERGLRLMLASLLSNALLYTQSGGHIEISGDMQEGRTWIEVRDNGPGFDTERISGDTGRADSSSRYGDQDGRRKGLGLQVVDTICTLHEGRMSVESRTDGPRRGTIVRLSFPRFSAARGANTNTPVTRDPANDRMKFFI
ncbi:MAG: ATP-binding protein [Pacificimonas sp.]